MKKRFFAALLVVALMGALLATMMLSVSAVIPSYGIYVGGVQVNEDNASDVLEDGTVHYDPEGKILTLNGANITGYHAANIKQDDNYIGIYSEVDGLTINLVGENKITTKAVDSDMPDGSEMAILSTKDLKISGDGSLLATAFTAVGSMQSLTVEDCSISCSWMGLISMGDVNVNGATLAAKIYLIGTETGDITLKNTTVTDGGQCLSMVTESGDITIEDSDITADCTFPGEDETQCLMLGQGNLTVKNSVLNLTAKMFATFANGKINFENVTGSIEMCGEAGYAVYAASDIVLKGCDLDISCRATDDAGVGISTMGDITIEDSSLTMDVRAAKDYAVGIGFPEGENGSVHIENSTLDISATGPVAVGIVSSSVRLTDSVTKIEVSANPDDTGAGVGVFATNGRAIINGGVLDVTSTGPANGQFPTCGILLSNPNIASEFIGSDVKLRGNVAIGAAPDLTLYNREYEIVASPNFNGSEPVEYNKENIATYKYLHIHPFYTVTFNANDGTGTMDTAENLYGTFTIPENGFTAPDGKQFKGWAYTADGEAIPGTSIDVQEDITLYAIWEDIPGDKGNDDPVIAPNPTPGEENDPDHTHSYSAEWMQTTEEHYKACACGAKQYQSAHVDSNDNGSCDVCGALYTENSGDGGLCAGAIVGIVIGAVLIIGIGGFGVFWFVIKKKNVADLVGLFKK